MEVADCRLKLDKNGSDVAKRSVTPAEVMVLNTMFEKVVNGVAITEVHIWGTTKRSNAEEGQRLAGKYGSSKFKDGDNFVPVVKTLFPGADPRLPQKFSELPNVKITTGKREKLESYNPDPKDDEVRILEGVDVDAFVDGVKEGEAGDVAPVEESSPSIAEIVRSKPSKR
jgi:hypothetical protein